jgi:hypothetical protein
MIAAATSSVSARACAFRGSVKRFTSSKVVHTPTARRGGAVIRASGIDPESLAILQQRLGQRIELEGSGAEALNATAGKLLGADGRVIDKEERKKVMKADDVGKQALEISYDPEGLFPEVDETASSMLIDKKLRQREMELEKEKEDEQKEEYEKARAELEEARDARVQPTSDTELIEYLFSTEFNEMEYEIVKQRPLLTDDFFTYLIDRMNTTDDADEKEKLDALYKVTGDFVGFVDQTTRAMLSPLERLTKLLNAPDKRSMILEMVDKDELDLNLMALLKTNINTARQGGAEDAAVFMEKIYKAAAKFVEGA